MKTIEKDYRTINTQQNNTSLIKSGQAKVIRISQFLPKEDNDALYKAVCKERNTFKSYKFSGSDNETTSFLELSPKSNNNSDTILI